MFRLFKSWITRLSAALRMLSCVVLFFATCVVAEEDQGTETIIVVGKDRSEQSLNDVDIARYTGFAKVIDRSEFEDRFTTFSELLNDVPSVQVRQFGGVGSNAVISMRGSTGKQVNVFLDGFLLNSAFSGSPNMDSIPTLLVERIEVYPDFTPIKLSNANIAGAVNFKTRDIPKGEFGGQASVAYGSFDTQQLEVSSWFDVSDWQVIIAGTLVESENDFPLNDELFEDPFSSLDPNSGERVNDGYKNKSAFVKVDKDFSSVKSSWLVQYFKDEKEVPSEKNSAEFDEAKLNTDNLKLQWLLDYSLGDLDVVNRLFYSDEQAIFIDPNGAIGLNPVGTDQLTDQEAYGVFTVAKYFFGGHEVGISLDVRSDEMFQEERLDNVVKVDGGRRSIVFSIGDDYFVSDNVQLNFNLRRYSIEDSLDYHESSGGVISESKIDAGAWHIGSQYFLTESFQFKVNLAESVRVPSLMEKFGNSGLYHGNPDLVEEKAKTLDGGFIFDFQGGQLQSSVFYRELEDGVYTLYNSQGIASPENTAESVMFGISASLMVALSERFKLLGNLSLMDSDNLSDVPSSYGKKLPGIYHENYGVEAVYQSQWVRFSVLYQFYDDLYYIPSNGVSADAKDLIDVSLTFFLEPITVDVTVRNLLDENYLDYNYRPTPGASYMTTLSFNF